MKGDPVFAPIRQLAGLVRTGEASPVELTELFLYRLETLGPRFNAVVTVTRNRPREELRWSGARYATINQGNFEAVARRKLEQLNQAGHLDDLRVPPGNRLEALKGDRAGQYSIRINDQFRVCFRWTGTDAEDVEIVDYH